MASAYDQLEAVMRAETLDFVQVNYAADDRAAEARILPLAKARGMAVLVNRPFGGGGLLRRLAARPLPAWAGEIGCASCPAAGEIRPWPRRRDLRHPRHEQSPTHARQRRRGDGAAAGCGDAGEDCGGGGGLRTPSLRHGIIDTEPAIEAHPVQTISSVEELHLT
jgi:hypothetical protein